MVRDRKRQGTSGRRWAPYLNGRSHLMATVTTSEEVGIQPAAPYWAVAGRKYAVEAIGSFFLTFAVAVSVLTHSAFTPLAAGATLMVMVYAGGPNSGGPYNPAGPHAAP